MKKTTIEYEELLLKWLVYKHSVSEINSNTELLVRLGQIAVIVCDGTISRVFEPGRYQLRLEDIPGIEKHRTLLGAGMQKVSADVLFFNTTVFMNFSWGTKDPVIRKDKDFKIIRLTAYGHYSFRIRDWDVFLQKVYGARLIGTETEETIKYISDVISQTVAGCLANCNIALIDFATQYESFAKTICDETNTKLVTLGMEIVQLTVENIGTTKAVNDTIDDYASMNLVKNDFDEFERFLRIKNSRNEISRPGNAMANPVGMIDGKEIVRIID